MLFSKKKEKKEIEKKPEKAPEAQPVVLPAKPAKIAHRILIKPIITEKATGLETLNKYVFEVSPRTNKIEIKKAIKELYNVEPLKIQIINIKGKFVRYGRARGKTKNWKKAIVTLKRGEKIDFTKK
ncbi:MAG: 50S ribosomal protein L23 [Patescibacteria group bacterium]